MKDMTENLKGLFNLGVVGLWSIEHNVSYMACGCQWEGRDYHYIRKGCAKHPHPAARVSLCRVYIYDPKYGKCQPYILRQYFERSDAEWAAYQHYIYLDRAMQGVTNKLPKFAIRCIREHLAAHVGGNVDTITKAMQLHSMVRAQRRQEAKDEAFKSSGRVYPGGTLDTATLPTPDGRNQDDALQPQTTRIRRTRSAPVRRARPSA